MNLDISRRHALAALACLSTAAKPLWAQPVWPSKALRFIVPYPAGGAPDNFTRQLTEVLAKQLGVSMIVEAKPGASGLLGMRAVSQAPADHHTLAYIGSGLVTLTAMNPKFDLLKELRPVARTHAAPFVAIVRSDSSIKTTADLIGEVQAKPDQLTFGTAGQGSPAHMAVEYLAESTKNFRALQIPFKGAVESLNAVIGGQIDFTIATMGAALPHIKSGRLRALAVTTAKRVPLLPEVPTISESGGGDYAYSAWGGLAMHIDTPDQVVAQMAAAVAIALQAGTVQRYLANVGGTTYPSGSPAEFDAQVRRDIASEKAIIKRLGIVKE